MGQTQPSAERERQVAAVATGKPSATGGPPEHGDILIALMTTIPESSSLVSFPKLK
ncbi:hypothetical protein P3L10_004883 [Capsicum annuum]